ncbi:2-oxoglutarate dehydrogenase E1 component [Serratia fonticola]|uniref:oxoglutarate dehydrogenase (succinyl-transferring) n=1 Tax=Serratia fonticola TaxID=47917 RepID=A0A4U9UJT0_SERFO|nr:2-oxoglutarate dehydrogenase E1 component [Serratia fonticola]
MVHLALAFNPSHLEIVSPVVMGSVRARRDRLDEARSNMVLPITIHGDAAITGQGVVQETLNMSQARGYEVGGTVRIVINNQVWFHYLPTRWTRVPPNTVPISPRWCRLQFSTVNADDPEAVAFVTRLALDFRNTFKRDVMIDLVCYRRHGHNEADEPSATQPVMYQKIKKHPTPRKLYADVLTEQKVASLEDATEMVNLYRDALDRGDCVVEEWRPMNLHSFHLVAIPEP